MRPAKSKSGPVMVIGQLCTFWLYRYGKPAKVVEKEKGGNNNNNDDTYNIEIN